MTDRRESLPAPRASALVANLRRLGGRWSSTSHAGSGITARATRAAHAAVVPLLDTASAAVLTGTVVAAVDSWWRFAGERDPKLGQVVAVFGLYVAAGALFGCVIHMGLALEREIHLRLAARSTRLALAARLAFAALAGGGLVWSTTFRVFAISRMHAGAFAKYGPFIVVAAFCLGAMLLGSTAAWANRALRAGRRLGPLFVGVIAIAVAGALVYVDLTVYVALYSRIHTLLEAIACVLVFTTAGVVVHSRKIGRVLVGLRAVGVTSLAWLLLLTTNGAARERLERSLRPVWLQPIYAGRMLSRAQSLEELSRPPGEEGEKLAGISRLEERFDIRNTTLEPAWSAPFDEPAPLKQRLQAARRSPAPYNIAIFYVDTLRYDVAADPQSMPNLSEFNRQSLHFKKAYAAGSDTVRSVPALTGGSLAAEPDRSVDFLEVARRRGWHRTLVIPQSADEFLDKELPGFGFDERVRVDDYPSVRTDVWGYGADQPSAGKVVDRSLEWMKQNKDGKFLLWSFHFDQHNWRELNDTHVADVARRHGMPEGPGMRRYAAVARGIDAEFGRFLRGLDDLGLRDKTIVVFLSDHGEGVGRDGFWVHSIFLWEDLLRVPLAIRVPGMRPKVIEEPVSLMDLAPTLARWFDPNVPTSSYHGEDLLSYAVGGRPKRRLPLLIRSGDRESTLRIGVIEPAGDWKLLIQLESGLPELYKLTTADPDGENTADDAPQETMTLLNELVRSPIFPRPDPKQLAGAAPKPGGGA